jgi:ribosome maturation factor RimP
MFTYLHIDCLSLRSFKAMVTNIAKIEKECYPEYMRSLQFISSRNDLKEYCESEDIFAIYSNTTYILCTKDEIVEIPFKEIKKANLVFEFEDID